MRLLFAEDEVELSDAVVAVLKHNNYSVDAVYNGQDAYDYLSVQEYDGAILDIMMPGLDGVEVVKRIRKEGNQVPVIFLTAKSELDDRVLGLDAGADDYLTKPFAMKELLARIRSITRRVGEVTGNTLQFGDLSLDANTYSLSCGKQSISLPNKEFQMLEMMMRNPTVISPPFTRIESLPAIPFFPAVTEIVPPVITRSSLPTIPCSSAEFTVRDPVPLIVKSSFEKITPSTFVSPSASKVPVVERLFFVPSARVINVFLAFFT